MQIHDNMYTLKNITFVSIFFFFTLSEKETIMRSMNLYENWTAMVLIVSHKCKSLKLTMINLKEDHFVPKKGGSHTEKFDTDNRWDYWQIDILSIIFSSRHVIFFWGSFFCHICYRATNVIATDIWNLMILCWRYNKN